MSSEHRKYWSEYCLDGIDIEACPFDRKNFPTGPADMPPYFWNGSHRATAPPATHRGYSEARALIGQGTVSDIKNLTSEAVRIINQVFSRAYESQLPTSADAVPQPCLVKLRLSADLEEWRNSQRELGNVLPAKKCGIRKLSSEVLEILKVTDWPEAMVTKNSFFLLGFMNMLLGAADAPTLFSNYAADMVCSYEHSFYSIFPTLEALVEKGYRDPHALQTIGGQTRRSALRISEDYLKRKVDLEKRHKSSLAYYSARLNRRDAQIVLFLDSSVIGFPAEAISRGYDPAVAMSDTISGQICHCVIDVGSDMLNSEVMNSFLNVADITDTGIVSEHTLRQIYDAYAATVARVTTERWHEPAAKIGPALFFWQLLNDRHMFLRRALLGWSKARKIAAQPQFEADFDEVFDPYYRTTGFSRPLAPQYQCDGGDTCNRVEEFLSRNDKEELLRNLWRLLVLGPLEYVRRGQVDESQEEALVEGCSVQMARVYRQGLVIQMGWLTAHACHHAWQVNYLFEAAMFGSILDSGELMGKLDSYEDSD